jgi:hypothetical protein
MNLTNNIKQKKQITKKVDSICKYIKNWEDTG